MGIANLGQNSKKVNQDGSQSVPFNRSYWVVPGKLLAGCYPGSEYMDDPNTKIDSTG